MDRDALREELAQLRTERSADEANPVRSLFCAPCLALGAVVIAALWYFKQIDLATVISIAKFFVAFVVWALATQLVLKRVKVPMADSVRMHVLSVLSQGPLERAVDDPDSRVFSAPFQLRPLSAKKLNKPITWFVNNYYDFVKAQRLRPFPLWAEWLRWGSITVVGLVAFLFMTLDMWYAEWIGSDWFVPLFFFVMLTSNAFSAPIRQGIVLALSVYLGPADADSEPSMGQASSPLSVST